MPDRGTSESTIINDGSQNPGIPQRKLEPTANTESPFLQKNLSPKVLITALLQVWDEKYLCTDCFHHHRNLRHNDVYNCFRHPPTVDNLGRTSRPEVRPDDPICGEFIPKRDSHLEGRPR